MLSELDILEALAILTIRAQTNMTIDEAKKIAWEYHMNRLPILQQLQKSCPRRGIGKLFWEERRKDILYAHEMCARIQALDSEGKVMRWLGFIQGTWVTCGIYTLDDVKAHSRNRKVPYGI